jgi:hypothetical protein
MAIFLVVTGCLVVLPRPTHPGILPLPEVDQNAANKVEQQDRVRALRARDGHLSKDVRAVGELFRRAGLMMFDQHFVDDQLILSLRANAQTLNRTGHAEELLDLRGLQAELFVDEIRRWEHQLSQTASSASPSPDLQELGGSFAKIAPDAWIAEDGRLVLSTSELKLLFRAHWAEMTGLLKTPPFALSLNELRHYFRTLLLYPATNDRSAGGQALHRLASAQALSRLDPDYPTALAIGIFELQRGRPSVAAQSFESFIKSSPNGPWSNIARSHLALSRLQSSNATRY